jgi:RNA polymerase sigma-32 factor
VARDLGVDVAEVRQMEGRLAASDMAFDLGVDDDDDAIAPVQYLEDNSADPARQLEEADHEMRSIAGLQQALAQLDDRARDIIQRRWLNDESKATLQELADEYGVSAERIRQLEKNAMNKVKAQLVA